MSQKNNTEIKSPVESHGDAPDMPTPRENLTEQHHGENTKSVQDDRKIGQHNGAGRPPLMKK